ncbi:hypothetical protein B0T25DRAFT_443755, partial [Lasiosphaeria hispida]
NLCQLAKETREKGELLRLELRANDLTVAAAMDPARPEMETLLENITADTTLESLLSHDRSDWLTPRRRVFLALEIASSILQLQRTHWLSSPWSSQTIRLAITHEKQPVESAFILQDLGNRAEMGPMSREDREPQVAILELSILLLEIWHRKSIETWALEAKTELKPGDMGSRMIAAIRWQQETSKELFLDYLLAVENCLSICSKRLKCWDDVQFQEEYCENIIMPLLRSCEPWRHQSRPR